MTPPAVGEFNNFPPVHIVASGEGAPSAESDTPTVMQNATPTHETPWVKVAIGNVSEAAAP